MDTITREQMITHLVLMGWVPLAHDQYTPALYGNGYRIVQWMGTYKKELLPRKARVREGPWDGISSPTLERMFKAATES